MLVEKKQIYIKYIKLRFLKISLKELKSLMYFRFKCGRWLGKGVDDGSTERLLVAELMSRRMDMYGKYCL